MALFHLWNRKHTLQHDYFGRLIWFINNPYHEIKNILIVNTTKNKADFYSQEAEWNKLMSKLAQETFQPNFMDKAVKRFKVDRNMFRHVALKLNNPVKLRKLNNKSLFKLYQEIKQAHLRYTYFFWSPWATNEQVVPWFEQELKKHYPTEFDRIFEAITTPIRHNIMEEQLHKLLCYQVRGILAKKINNHVKKYQWLAVYSLLDKPFTKKDFLVYVVKKSKASAILRRDNELWRKRNKDFRQALAKLRKYHKLYQTAKLLNCYAWLRTVRVEIWREVLYLIQPFYHELEWRMGLNRNQAPHLTYEEIINFLTKGIKPNKGKIKAGELMYLRRGIFRVIRDKREIAKILNKELKFSDYTKIKKVTGNVACRGKTKGRVKIVMVPEDCKLLRKGEILVSNMTHPDYLYGMRKAAAIVTDEGGISCHAAIVSRELSKPCVIVTKIATKVFKDGDTVEVDANHGVVTLLKRKG
ncbi:MAG: PEP-utilizing enzyme [Patescibacteria group bacterium]